MKIPRISPAPTSLAPLALAAVLLGHRAVAAQPASEDRPSPPAEPQPAPVTPGAPVTPSPPALPTAAGPPAVLADPAAPVADDAIDLDMLDLDPSAPSFDDSLQLYGFADFTWQRRWPALPNAPDASEFTVGNVNVYVRKNLTPRWRSLAEVRFLFAPNGGINSATGMFESTSTSDSANVERPISWGGVSIERVYLEYDLTRWLSVRAGRWLSPYGIWNIDHGSPTIIGVNRPYIVGEQFIPERQTGLELFGSRPYGDLTLEYRATISNGRNPYDATRDPDLRPAFGGRLALEIPWAGRWKLGVSAYTGRATEATKGIGSDDITAAYDEVDFGVDVAWDRGGLHVQGELLSQQRRYRDGQRGLRFNGFAPDALAWGVYGLAGYRFTTMWNAMPYAMVESYKALEPFIFGGVLDMSAGVNLRPTPAVVLKGELTFASFGDGGLYDDESIYLVRFQTAWVF